MYSKIYNQLISLQKELDIGASKKSQRNSVLYILHLTLFYKHSNYQLKLQFLKFVIISQPCCVVLMQALILLSADLFRKYFSVLTFHFLIVIVETSPPVY